MNENKIIYTKRVATRLIELGNIPVGTTPNPSRPEYICWIFNRNAKFERDVQLVMKEREEWKAAHPLPERTQPYRGFRATTVTTYDDVADTAD